MADVSKKSQVDDGMDVTEETTKAGADTAGNADEGIVIVDVETLLADKIPDMGADEAAEDESAAEDGAEDKSHSAFADALEDALGTSYEGEASEVDDDAPDPLDEILQETELDSASAVLQSGPASGGAKSGSGTMGNSSSDDDPSVVFGVFPPSYSNMPGGQPAQPGLAPAGAAQPGHGAFAGGDDAGWDNRALVTASGDVPPPKTGRSALVAGALGLLGGLAIVGGAATYAVKNDMVSLRGFEPEPPVQTATTRAKSPSMQSAAVESPAAVTPNVATPVAGGQRAAQRTTTPAPARPAFAATARVAAADVSGFARDPIPLSLVPQNTGGSSNFYVRVKGVPPGGRLSGGLHEGDGTWLLRPSGLRDVALKVPSYFTGKFTLSAQLVADDGKTPINAATSFLVDIKAEQVASGGAGNVEQQAASVVNQIATADRPKVAAFQPPSDNLERAPMAPAAGAAPVAPPAPTASQALDKLASLPGADIDEDIEEGLGALPTDFGDDPNFLKQRGIQPPLRAARAPRRSLLSGGGVPSPSPVGRVAAVAPAVQQPPVRAASSRSGGLGAVQAGAEARGLESAASVASGQPGFAASGTGVDEAELRRLIRQGDRFYKLGDLASARLFYLRAYENGSALGAMSVGRTYDPVYFNKLGVRGFHANPQKALEWYQKAVDAGLELARTKVADLNRWLGR